MFNGKLFCFTTTTLYDQRFLTVRALIVMTLKKSLPFCLNSDTRNSGIWGLAAENQSEWVGQEVLRREG